MDGQLTFQPNAALLLAEQMNLGWRPDAAVLCLSISKAAVAVVLLFYESVLFIWTPAGVDIICRPPSSSLLLSHGFIDPFHDPQNVTANTINNPFMVSSLRTAVAGWTILSSIEQSSVHLMRE